MLRYKACAAVLVLGFAAVALAQPTATVTLQSSQDGQGVGAGDVIDWTIQVSVSTGDNYGLALIACDLVQDADNPEKLDLPPGDPGSIDTTMQNFDRPAGITNPGEGGAASGYIGVQRGTTGEMNLIQIGGGQNTFGEALPPGTGIAENAEVNGGVGQEGSPQIVLSGQFAAPAHSGKYVFRVENALANVLTELNTPPDHSPVAAADMVLGEEAEIFFIVCPGDFNNSGFIDLSDLGILLAHYNQSGTFEEGDANGDGMVNLSDLGILLAAYNTPCP
jgi:hypothetical protein